MVSLLENDMLMKNNSRRQVARVGGPGSDRLEKYTTARESASFNAQQIVPRSFSRGSLRLG
jgi:hypothetical protein